MFVKELNDHSNLFCHIAGHTLVSLVPQMVKNPLAMQDSWI